MKFPLFRPLLAFLASAVFIAWMVPSLAHVQQINIAEFRPHFLELCDRAAAKIGDPDSKGPYFVDSYAVRALCVAYDLTGNPKYLDACRQWSERMVGYLRAGSGVVDWLNGWDLTKPQPFALASQGPSMLIYIMLMSFAERLDPDAIYREDGPKTSP